MTEPRIYYQNPKDEETIQLVVGGYFSVIPLPNNKLMYVNEEGELRKLAINYNASEMVGYPIYGNVIIANNLFI